MRTAAIQMRVEFAYVEENLKVTEQLASKAFRKGAEWVVLPEFFTSAMGFHTKMLDCARPINGEPMKLLKELAVK